MITGSYSDKFGISCFYIVKTINTAKNELNNMFGEQDMYWFLHCKKVFQDLIPHNQPRKQNKSSIPFDVPK